MPRFRRINIDGCSLFKTETRINKVAAFPGTAVRIEKATDQFIAVNGTTGGARPQIYVLDVAASQGLGVLDQVPAGVSSIGNYLEPGREFAVRMPAGTYTKDDPVVINASGQFAALPGAAGSYNVVGFVQEDAPVTLAQPDLIRIRVQFDDATVA